MLLTVCILFRLFVHPRSHTLLDYGHPANMCHSTGVFSNQTIVTKLFLAFLREFKSLLSRDSREGARPPANIPQGSCVFNPCAKATTSSILPHTIGLTQNMAHAPPASHSGAVFGTV